MKRTRVALGLALVLSLALSTGVSKAAPVAIGITFEGKADCGELTGVNYPIIGFVYFQRDGNHLTMRYVFTNATPNKRFEIQLWRLPCTLYRSLGYIRTNASGMASKTVATTVGANVHRFFATTYRNGVFNDTQEVLL